ncbi:ferrous iron transport protein B [Soonwooa sp.]|uniref:ferrous iron transport protein B n=1 Tax=Soonwooa sp. TaxID=1938592 RepID=UPI0028AB894F|nr:ferrous iron transport protein B [Soonwooa sp.]
MENQKNPNKKVLLVGNPNVGKSTIFNGLSKKKQKTGNYAGVTVASHSGQYEYEGENVEVVDLPGSYSIYPTSEDEAIFSKYLVEERNTYEGVIYVADAINLRRSLLLFQQIRDYGIPAIMVINQIDEAEKREINIDIKKLSELLNVPVFKSNAKKNIGLEDIKKAIKNSEFTTTEKISFEIPVEQKEIVTRISEQTDEANQYRVWTLLAADNYIGQLSNINEILKKEDVSCHVPKRLQVQETIRRYQVIDDMLSQVVQKKPAFKELLTEKLDKVLVHKVWGYVFFFLILMLVFESVFFIAEFPMAWIEDGFAWLTDWAAATIPPGPINSLITTGIIPGIGGILVFAPQIGIMLYFLYLLEDSGYMARVVFLMDKFLRPFGLNGKSIVPLVSGVACAIPAIMSTRNIENTKERLITILATPFMTCAARIPVYSILITLVIPDKTFLGFGYQALALMAMYLLGFVLALLAALVSKFFIKSKTKSFLVMDLPTYKMPLWGYNVKLMLEKVWGFVTGAGKVIFAVSVILWVLSYFGPKQQPDQFVASEVSLQDSYLGKVGHFIEPAIRPLGYDWKMGIGLLSSFAAREVFVGTMSTLYSLDDEAPEGKLLDKMHHDTYPNGEKVFTLATGISLLMFYAFAMQCFTTIAVVYRETGSWKLTATQTVVMCILAYFVSLLTYQILK